MMHRVLAAACIVAVCGGASLPVISGPPPPPPWTPVDWRSLPPASATDEVQVLYLVAPLLEDDFGKWLSYFRAFHGALAFINLNTGFNITINYDADNFFRATLFPLISKLKNGTKVLDFENRGSNFIYMGINETYWEEEMTLVGTINGTAFNSFMSGFNAQTNATRPFYNMLAITESFSKPPLVPSYDCFQFFFESLSNLRDLGLVYVQNLTTLNSNYANIYSKHAENVTADYYFDEKQHERIVQFYEFMEAKVFHLNPIQLLEEVFRTFEGQFYLRVSTDIWRANLTYPFIGIDWWPRTLPA